MRRRSVRRSHSAAPLVVGALTVVVLTLCAFAAVRSRQSALNRS